VLPSKRDAEQRARVRTVPMVAVKHDHASSPELLKLKRAAELPFLLVILTD
jgi:hypothetical protein